MAAAIRDEIIPGLEFLCLWLESRWVLLLVVTATLTLLLSPPPQLPSADSSRRSGQLKLVLRRLLLFELESELITATRRDLGAGLGLRLPLGLG